MAPGNPLLSFSSVGAVGGRLLVEFTDADNGRNVTFTRNQAKALQPQFHITPVSGWMNDPNGMFQLGALYHVFFQYNPASGNATSESAMPS